MIKVFTKYSLMAGVLAISSLLPLSSYAEGKHKHKKYFTHNILLQLFDASDTPVPGTEFWVTVDIIKKKHKVVLQLPLINFVTGPAAHGNEQVAGYLNTVKCFLPEELRPDATRSFTGASNNGMSPVFSFTNPSAFPVPPVGFIVEVTADGALVIKGEGTVGNLIQPGPQILLPFTIKYDR